MHTVTTQLADSRHGEQLREADRARLATGARAARRSARRTRPAATPASRVILAILLRPLVQAGGGTKHTRREMRQGVHAASGQAIIGYVYGKRG